MWSRNGRAREGSPHPAYRLRLHPRPATETAARLRRNADPMESSAMKAEKMNAGRLLTAIAGAAMLAGCMVGPNYHRPAVQTPDSFRNLADNPQLQAQTASYADLPWWQVFQDPKLQELIRTALKQNYDLQLATERINAARAQLAVTRSSLFPQVTGNADFNGGKENLGQ